jgi:hypothetical protein
MTTYVDSARIPARVGRIEGIWSHLTADTPTELHELAQRIGLQRRWYQGKCSAAKRGKCDVLAGSCVHYHYDVTESRRDAAVAAGATEIDLREMGDLIRARRQKLRGNSTT